jgi:cobalt/nickel transport system permease protein
MIQGEFDIGDSVIHRLDPRGRLVIAVFFSVVAAVSDDFSVLFMLLCAGAGLVVLARLSPVNVLSRLLIANGFIAFLWVMLPLTVPGEPMFSLWRLTGTHEGVRLAARIALKCNAILSALMALAATMSVFDTAKALKRLYVPEKLVYFIFFTYRYIHVIEAEYRRLMRAAKTRGFRPRTNMHTYRTIANLVGMTFVKSHERAERVRAAMRCRGFNGRFYDLSAFSFKTGDWFFMGVAVLALACMTVPWWID